MHMLSSRKQDIDAIFAAISRALCVVEFTPDGLILDANDHFLTAMGYARGEIIGRHHSMFMNDATASGDDYAGFWHRLRRGEPKTARRAPYLARAGRMVWFHGSYIPVLDRLGRVCRIVKVAADVTAEHLRDLETEILSGVFDPVRPMPESAGGGFPHLGARVAATMSMVA